MFLTIKRAKNKDGSVREYACVCETQRVGKRVQQRVVATLGRVDHLSSHELLRLAQSLQDLAQGKLQLHRARGEALRTHTAKVWGPCVVFDHLFRELGLEGLLEQVKRERALLFPLTEAVFLMVLNRLLAPDSKRQVHEWRHSVYWPAFEGVELHHLYRALDVLHETKDRIEERLFARAMTILGLDVSLVLWDTTSTYFEGKGPEGLAKFGHSKDARPDRTQVVIGVLISGEGIPIAHEVFPGNTADVASFRRAIEAARSRFGLRRVVFVADRGMVSEDILAELREAKLEYIVGVRMRQDRNGYAALVQGGRYHKVAENLLVKETKVADDRYIVCLNPMRREHDRRVRRETLKRLREAIRQGRVRSLVGHSGYRRYLKLSGSVGIDEERLREERRFDGKRVLRTNTTLSAEQVAVAYKSLWQVEHVFRRLKSGLLLRPMYHWTEERVRGHIVVCFLAFVLETMLRRSLLQKAPDLSYRKALDSLRGIFAVEVTVEGIRYLCRTDLSREASQVFEALGRRPPGYVTRIDR